VQVNQRVGATKPLLESFLNHLARNTDINDWTSYVRYVEAEQEYWEVIRRRKKDIARISFTFIPPNALGADDRIYQLVKDISSEAHPDLQQHVYRAPPGKMEPETPLMKASAKIAMAGGGEAELRDGDNKIIYSSGQAKVVQSAPSEDMPDAKNPSFVGRLISRFF
jgi:hypothetical protein